MVLNNLQNRIWSCKRSVRRSKIRRRIAVMLTLAGIIAFLLNGFFVNKSDVFDKNGGANIHTSIELSMLHPIGEKRLVDGNKEHLAEVLCVYSDVRGNVGLIILNANAFNDKRIKNITYPSRSKGNSVLISGKSVSIPDGTQEYINKIDSGVLLALTGTNTPFDCGKYCLAASLDYKIENYTVKYTGLIVAGIGALWVILVTVRIWLTKKRLATLREKIWEDVPNTNYL